MMRYLWREQELNEDDDIRRVIREVTAEVSRFSYALFALDARGRPDLYSSCVLIECDDIPVLVTAAHSVREIEKTGSAVRVGKRHLVEIPGKFKMSSRRGSDVLDIAAVVLPPVLVRTQDMEALRENRATFAMPLDNSCIRCVHGYPCSRNKQRKQIAVYGSTFTRRHMTYAGISPDKIDYRRFGKDSASHIALSYRRGTNEKGNRAQPPDPKGMSGGGQWFIPRMLEPSSVYLEGIAIEYHKQDALVFSTRINQVIDFIRADVLDQN